MKNNSKNTRRLCPNKIHSGNLKGDSLTAFTDVDKNVFGSNAKVLTSLVIHAVERFSRILRPLVLVIGQDLSGVGEFMHLTCTVAKYCC